MLVANPGHAPYTISSTRNHKTTSSIPSASQAASSSTAAYLAQPTKCSLIKTLAVRLNRGTDILKQSVQKAIISKIPQNFLSGTHSREVLTIPPTKTHREPNSSVNSTDSLRLEMCHFKPIRTVPTTPNKKSNNDLLHTPKAKRLVKLQLDEHDSDEYNIQPSPLQKILQQSPRKSAFYLVAAPVSPLDETDYMLGPSTSSQATHHKTNASNTCGKRKVGRKNPVVLLARLNLSRSKTKPEVNETGLNTKKDLSRQNGLLCELIREQKRCEERLAQEKRDFEIAKKLEAELNAVSQTVEPPNLRRRRRSIEDKEESALLLDTPAPPTKRCRRTCGRTLLLKEDEPAAMPQAKTACSTKIAHEKSAENSTTINLRRSNRNSKPTRRFIV